MNGQRSLFDPPYDGDGGWEAARVARDEGIARADANADPGWKHAAKRAVHRRAGTGVPFTADDLWDDLDHAGIRLPPTPAALGPVIQTAARRQIIAKTGRLVPTRLPHRHRDLVEWVGHQP